MKILKKIFLSCAVFSAFVAWMFLSPYFLYETVSCKQWVFYFLYCYFFPEVVVSSCFSRLDPGLAYYIGIFTCIPRVFFFLFLYWCLRHYEKINSFDYQTKRAHKEYLKKVQCYQKRQSGSSIKTDTSETTFQGEETSKNEES